MFVVCVHIPLCIYIGVHLPMECMNSYRNISSTTYNLMGKRTCQIVARTMQFNEVKDYLGVRGSGEWENLLWNGELVVSSAKDLCT